MIWKVPTRFCPRCRPIPCWQTRLSMPMSASSSLCLRQEKSSSFRPRVIESFNASTTKKCTKRATSWRTSIASSKNTARSRPAMTRPPETSSPASIWPPPSFGSIEDRPYIVVLVAVVVVPAKLGGYGAVFAAANEAFTAKGGDTGLILKPSQMLPYATLAFGSALAAFMYPHTLTGIFASKSADTIRKNAILLPAYTLLLGLIALLGYMAYAANIKVTSNNDVVPV